MPKKTREIAAKSSRKSTVGGSLHSDSDEGMVTWSDEFPAFFTSSDLRFDPWSEYLKETNEPFEAHPSPWS